ncbi:hypothetical protein FMM05_19535 [Flavobacterium zepuense]|uniref:PRTRC system protein F n=1 Tax=Flavobacterium zepuense TaxID=2593302 RepID=A0A552UUZ6_9FLAO|nr:hypothetical protein [Flavobacterium zepuense]TRW21980.1 hypothetical protein FMM05_19535 [Flavobacterium zepuense]
METLSANRHIRKRPEQAARCAGSTAQQGGGCPDPLTADGFLRHQFLPLYEASAKTPDQAHAEHQFFSCLSTLAKSKGFVPQDFKDKAYPYNILLAYDDAQRQLRNSGQDAVLSITQDGTGKLQLEVNNSYAIGRTLHYVPVLPLYRLMQDSSQRQTAELLLSVFAYLYHVARLPFYTEEDSYLFGYYECLKEWYEEGDEQENSLTGETTAALKNGEAVLEQVFDLRHLDSFSARVASFETGGYLNWSCLNVAKKALALFQEYPDQNIFRNMVCDIPEGEDEPIVEAYQYISFISDTSGSLFEQVNLMLNDAFNECCEMEQPALIEVFDTEGIPEGKGLDFEYRLFALLNDLCTLLNELP